MILYYILKRKKNLHLTMINLLMGSLCTFSSQIKSLLTQRSHLFYRLKPYFDVKYYYRLMRVRYTQSLLHNWI